MISYWTTIVERGISASGGQEALTEKEAAIRGAQAFVKILEREREYIPRVLLVEVSLHSERMQAGERYAVSIKPEYTFKV